MFHPNLPKRNLINQIERRLKRMKKSLSQNMDFFGLQSVGLAQNSHDQTSQIWFFLNNLKGELNLERYICLDEIEKNWSKMFFSAPTFGPYTLFRSIQFLQK